MLIVGIVIIILVAITIISCVFEPIAHHFPPQQDTSFLEDDYWTDK